MMGACTLSSDPEVRYLRVVMPRQARGEYVNPNEVQLIHAVQRCVRRAFLCGDDVVSGKSFEHRREWIRQRIEFLASVFGIDCLTYTVLSNHLHVVLRSRRDSKQSCQRSKNAEARTTSKPRVANC